MVTPPPPGPELADAVRQVLDGRFAAEVDDVRALAHPVLRHRIVASFRAEAEGVKATDVITAILAAVGAR